MNIETFINSDIPQLDPKCTVGEALRMINDFHVSELPVVIDGELTALINEEDLLDAANEEASIETITKKVVPPAVFYQMHPYEVATLMTVLNLSLVPVINDKEKFLGVITRHDLFSYFFERTGLMQPGGIIVLEMKPMDYSLSEIARICESCDATALNVQTFFKSENESMEVVVKTNKKDLQALKATFERYEYNIVEIFGMLPTQNDLIDRYRLLMNYINM